MRTPTFRVVALTALIALTACSSGRVIVVRQPPPPPPPPPRIAPLEITVARPIRGQLLVQTNRPSYVALFEIVPNRGVALLAPSYAHQRTWMLAGLNWIPVSWKMQSSMYYGPPSGTAVPARWVYAIASDVPLRLPDEAFDQTYMRRVLGPTAYRATNPYLTMRAIARAFVPSVIDEAWAEDAYALAATHTSDPYRVVRIYCANRTVYEVPEELADRAWCPVRVPAGGTIVRSIPVRPDSIVVGSGPRARRRLPEMIPVRPPVDRVQEPVRPADAPVVIEDGTPRQDPPKVGQDAKDVREPKDKRGNAYGHTDDPNVKGRGIENEKREDPRREDLRREPRVDPPVTVQPDAPPEKTEVKEQKREEKQEAKEAKQEAKQDATEAKQEQKQEAKEQKQEAKEEKQEQKQEPVEQKQEQKQEKQEAKEQKQEQKQEAKEQKPDVKQDDKQEAKQEVKQDAKQEAKEEKPGKPDSEPAIKRALKHKP